MLLSKTELIQKVSGEADPQPSDRPKIVGYGRRWSGGCDHCQLASERLYFRGDLAPIHEGCSCGVYPVFEGEEHGLFTVRKELSPLPNRMVEQDSPLGPRLDQSSETGPPFVDRSWMDRQFQDWFESLKEDEEGFGALDQYAANDSFRLNAALREGGDKLGEWVWLADLIDKNLAPLSQDVRTFRGGHGNLADAFGENPKVGDIISEKGFLSTTLSKDIASDFGEGEDGFLVEIISPKGTKAAWMEPINSHGESEVLLGHGLSMEIIKVVSPNHIVVKVVNDG